MDFTKENVNPNPREKANSLSIIFFTYTIGMFRKGYSKTLEVDDLYNPLTADKSQYLGDRLEKKWLQHLKKSKTLLKKPSFFRVLVATFWPEYLSLGILLAVMDIGVRIIQPLVLGKLLDYFRADTNVTKEVALWYAGILVILNGVSAFLINHYTMGASHYGMRVRAACCALIYRKALKLSKKALGETASGKIVNLISNDVSRFDLVSYLIHHMWVAPTSALCATYFLWAEAGYAGIVGVIPILLILPLQSYTGKLSAIYRKQTATKTDERVRLIDEIITGVQVIKMYAWEIPFGKLIKHIRKLELKIITKSSYVRALFMAFNLFTTRVALFSTLLTMALTGQRITAAKVFVLVSYFNVLSQTITSMFVRGIAEIAEAFVGVRRLQEFLLNEEYVATNSFNENINKKCVNGETVINVQDFTAKWSSDSADNTLTNINLTVPKGNLVGVIGPVGSGKSSLLQAILNELDVISGHIKVNGTISYASQEPWVFAATVRQNILFGQNYDKKRYNRVVTVCALHRDFEQFPNGDLTLIGDRGASLSGGQKARINLARAVYREADIYLLDDPLSAVDVHVGKHLFEKCINGYLGHKTRILVTHQVYHLKSANHIVVLRNGQIEAEGTFNQLQNHVNVFAKSLPEKEELIEVEEHKAADSAIVSRKMSTSCKTLNSSVSELSIVDGVTQQQANEEGHMQTKDLQEESSKGKIRGSLTRHYLLAGGNLFTVSNIFLLFVLAQVAASAVDYFVSYWTRIEEHRNVTSVGNDTVRTADKTSLEWSTDLCIYIYSGLIAALFVIAFTRSMLFYKLAMWSSEKLHNTMFDKVIGTSMRFFDTNPSGRILNRFSKDIGNIDEWLPKTMLDAAQYLFNIVGSLVLVAIVNPYFLVLITIISVFFSLLGHVFLKSSKNIKRLEAIMRSPVFIHLNATLQGLTTIRAYRAESILSEEFDKHQDYHTSTWFMYIAATAAFGFYLDVLCFIFTAFVTFSFLTFGEAFVEGGKVGLAITQATALTGVVTWGIRRSTEVANHLTAVERVLEYTALPQEKQPDTPKPLPQEWPQQGKITFKNVGLKYDENGTSVLNHLNFTIQPKKKVGIVGRTGAGKSSIIAAMFRLAQIEGSIEIDDIDTRLVSLQILRTKIAIIPQDPVLFSGTLRYNLDPFEKYPDDVLYKALADVELKDPTNTINRLENKVMDRGSNYSVGQRQLVCLARALIRNNKVLILDEATANVDPQTDALIQKTIREKFSNCTVLTVAHRLNSIMDSDKVMVMEAGTMVEFDHPYALLRNAHGRFARMVAETGQSTYEQLRKIAKDCYDKSVQ